MFSRIDYILATSNLVPTVDRVVFLPRNISDHNAILISFNLDFLQGTPSRWRFSTTLLRNESISHKLKPNWKNLLILTKIQSRITELFGWRSRASYVTMQLVSHLILKCRLQKISQLEQACSNLERELKDN